MAEDPKTSEETTEEEDTERQNLDDMTVLDGAGQSEDIDAESMADISSEGVEDSGGSSSINMGSREQATEDAANVMSALTDIEGFSQVSRGEEEEEVADDALDLGTQEFQAAEEESVGIESTATRYQTSETEAGAEEEDGEELAASARSGTSAQGGFGVGEEEEEEEAEEEAERAAEEAAQELAEEEEQEAEEQEAEAEPEPEPEPVFEDTIASEASLETADASGTEDGAISLNIASGLTDTDGSESLSITIEGVPEGAELSAGTDNGDGTWTLEPGDLEGLTVTPPENSDNDFTLSVTATTTESFGGDQTSVTGSINVSVDADADAPTLVLEDSASGTEDGGAIPLDISSGLTDTDGSESLSITIEGVPEGAELSAGTDNGDGTWTLEADDLEGLTITPAENSDEDFSLSVTATSTEGGGGDTATTTGTIDISVDAEADAPTLVMDNASGTEDNAISLDLSSGLTDTDGSESLSITIEGVPEGAELSAGTDNGDGTWTLDAGDLEGLTVTPAENSDEDFTLSVTATSTEADGGDTATTTGTINVSVEADADAPTLELTDTASGTEDGAISLDIASGLTDTDGSESLSITIEGVPEGAELSSGTDNGDGTWTLDAGDLEGLTITPPENSDEDFSLSVTATSTEADGGDSESVSGTINVSVDAEADAPTLELTDTASGTEDGAISLDIASGLTDTDGSESLSITIEGVPEGAELSAGIDNGDGTWTLDAGDLEGLTVTPPEDSDEDFSLSVTATSTEADGGDTATTTGTINVSVDADADAPTLELTDTASGTEDGAISLDIASGLTDTDGSESLSITIEGVPEGAELSAGTDNGDGTWTLDAGDLEGLTVTPAENSDEDFSLSVTATSTEADGGDTAITTGTIDVSVDAEADAPTLVMDDSASGTEDGAISLDIASGLTDTDGSESLSITIEGVPEGAELSAGTD
ncbi:MAG: hypothetical protein HQL71_03150, partial [Magnetococcales bacterium]|nr:hypothetical protein [Magnetococcales bacterium]